MAQDVKSLSTLPLFLLLNHPITTPKKKKKRIKKMKIITETSLTQILGSTYCFAKPRLFLDNIFGNYHYPTSNQLGLFNAFKTDLGTNTPWTLDVN